MRTRMVAAVVVFVTTSVGVACRRSQHADPAAGAPPSAQVEHESDDGVVRVAHPEQFSIVVASQRDAAPELKVTGVVAPDVSRNVPVISLASGRVIEVRARLGDVVKKGQLVMRVQSADVSAAFSDYRKSEADEALARMQLERSQSLYDRGAVARKDWEVAQATAAKARVDLEATRERLRVLGVDSMHPPNGIVDIVAPISGIITEQNVTNAAGVKTLDNSPNLFTISDVSTVWIVCDVYENDLGSLHLGDQAEIRLNAYPDRSLQGRLSNISAALDTTLRTAKVRIEVHNPGLLKMGMFVTATFRGQTMRSSTVVPAAAILHLHDRDWVYVPTDERQFRRFEVVSGAILPGNMQELRSGLRPGQRVVANALVFQNTTEQ